MTLDEEYPDVDRFTLVEDVFMASGSVLPCVICRTPTRFLEINFEVFCCTPVCADRLWHDFAEANLRRNIELGLIGNRLKAFDA